MNKCYFKGAWYEIDGVKLYSDGHGNLTNSNEDNYIAPDKLSLDFKITSITFSRRYCSRIQRKGRFGRKRKLFKIEKRHWELGENDEH